MSKKQEQIQEVEDHRTHFEGLGQQWAVLVGNPKGLMPQIVGTIIHSGGSRPCWQRKDSTKETILMAWPQDQPVRAATIMQGLLEEELKPVTAMPLLEGYPNTLEVDSSVPWKSGVEANVSACILEGKKPLWFYNPLYYRDKEDLTPGVSHTFLVAGLAFGIRKALIDEMTITQGPLYEAHAARWLEENTDKSRLDVPALKVNLAGKQVIMPGRHYCEYEVRSTILEVQQCMLDKLEVSMLRIDFPMPDREALHVMLYVPKTVLKGYEPKVGDDIDAYVWLQGRIMDFEPDTASSDTVQ